MKYDPHQIIRRPAISEKGTMLAERQNKYVFEVATEANKIEIKRAVEEIFKVSVTKVNTLMMPGKKKRVRYKLGFTPSWKKAIVTLKQGDRIELF